MLSRHPATPTLYDFCVDSGVHMGYVYPVMKHTRLTRTYISPESFDRLKQIAEQDQRDNYIVMDRLIDREWSRRQRRSKPRS